MTEQKQSLADFVFENKDKMPDNVYKILMEQYAKAEQHPKGFEEVEYLMPRILPRGDGEYELDYMKRIVIVKKYDDRFYESWKEIKVGLVPFGRVKRSAYMTMNEISFHNVLIIKDTQEGLDDWEVEKGADYYHLMCKEVFVVSVKDL